MCSALVVASFATGCSPGQPDAGGDTPAPRRTGPPVARAAAIAKSLNQTQLVGQVLMPFVYGDHASKISDASAAANLEAYGASTPAKVLRRYQLGGLILVSQSADPTSSTNPTTNVDSPKQVRELTSGLQHAATKLGVARNAGEPMPLLIGTDQEHGVVTRIRDGMTLLPTAAGFGAAADPALTERAWKMGGGELSAVGVNVDFAPSADVIGSAGNQVIGSRSYGSDPAQVAKQVRAAVRGLQGAGVAAALKHFPGHGHTTADSHSELPLLAYHKDTLSRQDLPPFQAGIAEDAGLVMSGHLDVRGIDPGVAATFSRKVLIGLLRQKLGFDGVVVSDAMNMEPARKWGPGEAAVRAVLAGNDLLLMPPDLDAAQRGLLRAMKSGRLPRERMVQAVTRILTLKLHLAGERQANLSAVGSAPHQEVAAEAAKAAVTVLRGSCGSALVSGSAQVTGGLEEQRKWLAEGLREHGVKVADDGPAVHLTGYGDTAEDLASDAAVTVGMDTPYLLAKAKSPAVVAAYGGNRFAMRAAAAVIAGAGKASGRSPAPVDGLPRTACGNAA